MKTSGKIWLFYDAEKKVQSKPMSVVQAQVFLLSLRKSDFLKFFLWTPGWAEWICIRDFIKSDQTYFVLGKPPKPDEKINDPVPAHPGKSHKKPVEPNEFDDDKTQTAILSAPETVSGVDSPYTQVVTGQKPLQQSDFGYYHQDFNGDDLDLSQIRKIKGEARKKPLQEKPALAKASSGSDRRRDERHNFKIEVVLVSKYKSFRTYSRDISLSGTQLEDEIPKDFLNFPFDLIIVNPYEKDPTKSRLLFRAKIVGDMTDPRRLMFIEQDVEMTLKLDALLKAYVAYQEHLRKSAG